MTRISTLLPAMSLALVLAWPAVGADEHVIVANETITWEPAKALPSGADWSVLTGNPGEAGPFAIRLRFPAGYEVPAHWHSQDEMVTVLSGAFGIGIGDLANHAKIEMLGPGGFFRMPAQMPHYALVRQETVIQVSGNGPFDLNYINPSEDPRKQVGSSQ